MPIRNDDALIDLHVGGCIRMRRLSLGFSQQKLASSVGVTFQQVQKYEHGKTRISASRLYEIGQVLGMEPSDFFEGFSSDGAARVNDTIAAYERISPQFGVRELVELNEAFRNIASTDIRRAILRLMTSLTETQRERHEEEKDGRALARGSSRLPMAQG